MKNYYCTIILLFIALFTPLKVTAQYLDVKKGNDFYKKKNIKEALSYYEKVISEEKDLADKKEAIFNKGNALLKQGKPENASESYRIISDNDNLPANLRANAYYNLGNAAYEHSEKETNPEKKQQHLKKALEYIKESMRLDPNDLDAKQNYEYIKSRLQKPQSESNSNQQDNKQNEENNKQNQQDNKQNQDQDDQEKKQPPKQNNQKEQPSKEEVERFLDAIQQNEEDLLKKYQKQDSKTLTLDKDW